MQYGGCVYILTNKNRTTLYIGVTSNLRNRVYQHKIKFYPNSFSALYNLNICIYYESFARIEEAIAREKQLKKWSRSKKEALIYKLNPSWKDLWEEIKLW
ncbi:MULTISPECIES: GIY-YIG nuclease family protein [Olivibacter]|uniref:Excinuclease ABC C subunit domain protein n=2 Tax=Sphingobacteriaceae TaxID=84566 RepID=F4C997_SPHS2